MRGAGIVIVAGLGLPLAGCFGVMLPPKELPDWAMTPPRAETASPVRAKTVWHRRTTADRTASLSSVAASNKPAEDIKPFSPEWQARENAFDEKLRRRMNICGGC